MAKALRYALYAWVSCTLIFTVLRLLSFGALAGDLANSPPSETDAFLVGWLSDVWVGLLWGMIVLFLAGLPKVWKGHPVGRGAFFLVVAFNGIAAAFHLAYIDFFHFQIVPFHLTYLTDGNFMAANSASAFQGGSLWIFAASALAVGVFSGWDPLSKLEGRSLGTISAVVLLACLLAHNRNIHLRVQWFVPTELQTNGWEHLYLAMGKDRTPAALSEADWTFLEAHLGKDLAGATERERLVKLLVRKDANPDLVPEPFGRLRNAFQKAVREGRKPLVAVLLLESQRPADVVPRKDGKALAPQLNLLAMDRAFTWLNAYSSGTVTRGAQEAAFCGYPGSQATSAMRGRSDVQLDCLPKVLEGKAETLWLHGGAGGFDSQKAFWTGQDVGRLLTELDFPEDAPRTGWGVGDRTFYERAIKELIQARETTSAPSLLAMLLSISNHIPWNMPGDAQGLRQPENAAHPSYATTAYADYAMGWFIAALKQYGFWEDTILVIMNDHGNTIEPFNPQYFPDSKTRSARLQTHLVMMLTGGLAQSVTETAQISHLPVGQTDVAALIADLYGEELPMLIGENPFLAVRWRPVLADLGDEVFNPVTDRIYRSREIKGETTPEEPEDRAAVLYFRAFLRLLNLWNG